MLTTDLCTTQTGTTATGVAPAATGACTRGYQASLAATRLASSDRSAWIVIEDKGMNVPAFHGRWPLCSP